MGCECRSLVAAAGAVLSDWCGGVARLSGKRERVSECAGVYLPCNYEYDLICRNNKRSELGN